MTDTYQLIPLKQVHEDPNQPRRQIDEDAVQEMAETMRTSGVIQPVVVRPDGRGYTLIVGHRRRRAAQHAGLKEIPAVVREDVTDLEVMRMQAVEDAQNQELDPRDRFSFWAKLWNEEKKGNPRLTMARFAKEIIGLSPTYVSAGIDVAEKAPAELREILGPQEEGKLNPTYARYLMKDRSLSDDEKVAVGKKIARQKLPASSGRIGTETLKTIRTAPPKVRERLIHDPDYSLEEAGWALKHEERKQVAQKVKTDRTLTPGQVGIKVLRAILDFHTKLDPRVAPFLSDGAWEEIDDRLQRLIGRIEEFQSARDEPPPKGEEIVDAIDVKYLEKLLSGDDAEDQAR
jgi:ParB/RepB/Spo0J family partition protein